MLPLSSRSTFSGLRSRVAVDDQLSVARVDRGDHLCEEAGGRGEGEGEGSGYLREEAGGLGLLYLPALHDVREELAAAHVLSHQVDGVDLLHRLEQVQQVRVLHAVQNGDLVHEALPRVVVRDLALLEHLEARGHRGWAQRRVGTEGCLREEHLDRHRLASVPLHRQHDLAEGALTHRLEERVVADRLHLRHARPRLCRARGTALHAVCFGVVCTHASRLAARLLERVTNKSQFLVAVSQATTRFTLQPAMPLRATQEETEGHDAFSAVASASAHCERERPGGRAVGMKKRVVVDSDDDDDDAPQAAPTEQAAEAAEGAKQPVENDSDKEDLFGDNEEEAPAPAAEADDAAEGEGAADEEEA
eukprot:scaffold74997_cov45-Phaeocystis_antarctica.AAC.1